mmetsp:Transcript_80826/g.208101  ORF Transcript_80826/g.208101 Transcript_80826/m.208101 type:complete len:497 (+) Transcript_80826:59-1549(+)
MGGAPRDTAPLAKGKDSDARAQRNRPACGSPSFGDAVSRLRSYNSATPAPTNEAVEASEEAEFQKLKAKEREDAERRCPSLKSIPRFFERRTSPLDDSNSLRLRVQRAARMQLLNRKESNEELLDEEDCDCVLEMLKEQARERCSGAETFSNVEVIDYDGFRKIGRELAKRGDRFRQFFIPSTFLKFPRDQNGCIAIDPFFTFVVRKVNIKQTRVYLSHYDVLGCGYLREKDMENFIFELIPTLPQLNSLQEEFYPFYVFTAVRKFFFFLDPKRTGRVRIRDLLSSPIIIELYELRQEQRLGASEAESNWFSMQSALRVYGAYLELDVDQNGMLSKNELSRYGSGMLTDVFIDRVFEEYHTYRDSETGEREMDYKTFLDFVLAMENKNSREAIQYVWKIIDIHHKGCLDGFVINYFFRAIHDLFKKNKLEVPSVDDVQCEIFDMVKAKTPGVITQQDLCNCRQGGMVLKMMIDAEAFWRYENRESLMIQTDEDDEH